MKFYSAVAGKLTKETYGNSTYALYSYNNKLQLSSLAHYKIDTPNDTLIVSSDYTRDNMGSPLTMTWDGGSTTTTCTYDDINRLETVQYPGLSQETLVYDWVGNRTGGNWGVVNAVDQLPSDPFGNSYGYTPPTGPKDGNLYTRTKNSLNTTFTYDRYNLLSQITWPGDPAPQTTFVSDAAGNRLRMTTSTSVQYDFMYDTTAGIPAVLMEKTGTDPAKLYIRTPDGRLIARVTANITSPALDFYYHFDGLGSTLALTNSSGNATDTYTYDAWGKLTNHTGEIDQPYQFVGQLGYYTNYQDVKLDPESSDANKYVMLQLGVRYYVPEMGRFTQRDVLVVDGFSRYVYAGDLPSMFVDPTGLITEIYPGYPYLPPPPRLRPRPGASIGPMPYSPPAPPPAPPAWCHTRADCDRALRATLKSLEDYTEKFLKTCMAACLLLKKPDLIIECQGTCGLAATVGYSSGYAGAYTAHGLCLLTAR